MEQEEQKYRLNRLEVTNFTKIKSASISPEGNVVHVIGKNEQGKSSLINAIEAALCGGRKSPDKPIRTGEKKATIEIDLGGYYVERTWTEKGMSIVVKGKDGIPLPAPQTVLDELTGAVSFDPFAFSRMDKKEQAKMLIKALGLDFTAIDAEYKKEYDLRTAANKERDRVSGVVTEKRKAVQGYKKSDYASRIIIDDVLAAQKAAQGIRDEFEGIVTTREGCRERIVHAETAIAELEEKLRLKHEEIVNENKKIEATQRRYDELYDNLPEMAEYDDQIRNAGTHNELVAKFEELRKEEEALTLATSVASGHDKRVEEILADKQRMISEADLPIPGMTFDEDGIYINGIPLKQGSSAQNLKIAVALGMKMNPKLRVMRILNGSLLDKDSLVMIHEMAEENDFQFFIEIVGDKADGCGILIEDGMIVEDNTN